MSPLRVLITGGSGLLGRALVEKFSEGNKWEVTATARSRVPENSKIFRKLELSNEQEIRDLVKEINPHIIVHSAAIKGVDDCEKDANYTENVNVTSTKVLADLAAELPDTFLIFISTDYVFDGTNPPYKPNSTTNPLSSYGKSKVAAEQAIWQSGHNAGVLRIPVLYGHVENLAESAITALVKDLQLNVPADQRKSVKIENTQIRFPTFANDVAACVRALAERRMKHCSLSGTWHFSEGEPMTKYDVCLRIAKILNASVDHIQPDNEPKVGQNRPQNSKLDTASLKMMGLLKLTPFDEAMKEIFTKSPDLLK